MRAPEIEIGKRQSAIDPNHSFIVQAPAGSGKTELLTQRYLALLSLVSEPEEIVAITFTRKAASEMRERVLNALTSSQTISSDHKKLTQQLAQQVLLNDQKRSWNLSKNPGRLRILTIDALCAQLANQMPLLSQLSPQAKITEEASSLYEKAVLSLFKSFGDNSEISSALQHLLLAMDNRAENLMSLLIDILAKREQWLGLLVSYYREPEKLRSQLEKGLEQVIKESLILLNQRLNAELKKELFLLMQFAATHLSQSYEDHPLCCWLELDQFPEPHLDYYTHWLSLAQLLLTKEARSWRKSFDKRDGFPSEANDKQSKENLKRAKIALKAIIEVMAEDEELHELICNLLDAPACAYSEEQWSLLKEIIHLLPHLVAELNLVFHTENSIDFIELNLSALRALGSPENPTELALYLDYQIKHLLIDEFQDTSLVQFKLIEQLTTNWQEGDGRSLFLVGDPMQSIYRFRNAEVGLFLRVQQQGIGNIQLNCIHLKNNYRSDPEVISWINEIFHHSFPKLADISTGAITYSASESCKTTQAFAGVYPYPLLPDSTAEKTIELVKKYQALDPKAHIAILVRSRTQLEEIIPHLKKAGLKFKAIELEALSSRIEIEDLLSLTRALSHLADRTAWLAILRAPWCGLKLIDLHLIAQQASNKPLWYSLSQFNAIEGLSADAQERLNRCVPIWGKALSMKGSLPFAEWVNSCWLELKGPACLDDEHQLKNTERYFELLRALSEEKHFSLSLLNKKLNQLYAEAQPEANDDLQIMTIHKAKGLEFDHVILPHLESIQISESARLLRWLERPRLTEGSDLILAPFKHYGTAKESIYDYLLGVEKRKLMHESLRLLYVAASRSKTTLHLLFELEIDEDGEIKNPDARSFIYQLWPSLIAKLDLSSLKDAQATAKKVDISEKPRLLKRIVI